MDFFAAQDRAKARTRLLVVYFILGVAGLVVSLNVLAMVGESATGAYRARQDRDDLATGAANGLGWNPSVNVIVTLVTLAIVGGSCAYKVAELKAGGSAVALSVGATPLAPHPAGMEERQLRNIVEEMALASGVQVPEIYIMEEEEGINAFAAGLRPDTAAIVVTRGALKYLNRDELQGVIGHEFSHILNGDMRLNVELIGAVFGLLVIAIIGKGLLQTVGRTRVRGKDAGQAIIVMLLIGAALYAIGSLGVLFGRLIQAAVSRQREALADAAAVQFTRNPTGLAGALKKIGGLGAGSYINHAHAEETAHMYIAPALDTFFATHPPLEQRIRELEPSWDGKFINPVAGQFNEGLAKCADDVAPPSAVPPLAAAKVNQLLASAATVGALALAKARDWRENLPETIAHALNDPVGCRALVLALALDPGLARREAQIARLREQQEPAVSALEALLPNVDTLEDGRRLPLLELALAGLANLPPPEKIFLIARLRELTGFDRGNQNMYQFALWRVTQCRLNPQPPRLGPPQAEYYRKDISVVLSALAHLSTPDDAAALPVYQQGLTALPALANLSLTPRAHATLADIEGACMRLESTPFALKKQLLEAGALIVQADGVVEPAEGELLRAIAASLGCPMPLN